MTLKKGILIVFEGIDGAGKSTQARILKQRLESAGFRIAFFREPSRGPWGRLIRKKAVLSRSLTPEEELSLFQKDREENVARNLKPALKGKKAVLLDRYYFSTMAYQGAKGIDPGRIRRTNERFCPPPDIVFVLDIPPQKGLKRIEGRKRKEKLFEREAYLRRVRKIFNELKGNKFIHLDASQERGELARVIAEKTLALLHHHSRESRSPRSSLP